LDRGTESVRKSDANEGVLMVYKNITIGMLLIARR